MADSINIVYLYEGLNIDDFRTMKLWESAGSYIFEANLTSAQIDTLFGEVEKAASAAGNNRSMIGKGKDKLSSVNKAWEDLKTKAQNSGPITGIDAKYDQAAEKLKQATGGDTGVMKYVDKYRTFAKKHPVAQGLIYSALIAAAGISGAGAGGAAALGLLKMTDKLLQGEKFSSAAYSGAKTGGAAYAAGQVGKAMRGGNTQHGLNADGTTSDAGLQRVQPHTSSHSGIMVANEPVIPGHALSPRQVSVVDTARSMGNEISPEVQAAYALAKQTTQESIKLSESQIDRVFIVAGLLSNVVNEGMWDSIKTGAKNIAGKVGSKLSTMGKNLTTKITADKLNKAWKKAGSPEDSKSIATILYNAGVTADVLKNAFRASGISTRGLPPAPAPTATAPTATAPATAPAPTATAPTATAPAPTATAPTTPKKRKSRAKTSQQTEPSAGSGAFAQMATTLGGPETQPAPEPKVRQTSTGGTATSTKTGMVHKANPNNPNRTAPEPAWSTHVRGKAKSNTQVEEELNRLRKLAGIF